jgi:cytochrome c-type biogenesis protein CcmH
MRQLVVLLSLSLVAVALAVTPATAAQPTPSLTDIEDEVMCPICGTPLNLADAPQAERERAFIRRLIAQGQTKDEILDALVREYGDEVLATPDSGGFDLAAWLVPAGALLVAVLALGFGVRHWRRGRPDAEPDAPPPELDPLDGERLRSDLANYDL